MEKNNFMLLFCMLLVISYSQPTKKGLNHLRKLDTAMNETILIGFDNYTKTPIDNEKNFNLSFNTYFLLKNWNKTIIEENEFNNINISSNINYHENMVKNTTPNAIFNCFRDKDYVKYFGKGEYTYHYYIMRYVCSYNSSGLYVPKKINLTTDFTNVNLLNDTQVSYVTTSAEGLKNNIVPLNSFIDSGNLRIMDNSTFISQSPYSFKIKSNDDDEYHRYYFGDSNNIELITKQKNIPCKGKYTGGNSNDGEESYYILETKGDNVGNYLANTDLKYAIANYTKTNKMFILDFKDGVNSTIKEKKEYKMSSGGLSTGGIIAVTIPTCAVLLGVAGLSFFLSRKNATPPPQIKTMNNMNMQNNTMGVIATSSEAVIHQ